MKTKTFYLLLLIAFVITLWSVVLPNCVDNDFWWHLSTGEIIANTGEFIHSTPESLTNPDNVWYYQSWLPQLVMRFIYISLGDFGTHLLYGLALACLATILYLFANQYLPVLYSFSLVLWSTMPIYALWISRPKNIALIFFALAYFLVEMIFSKFLDPSVKHKKVPKPLLPWIGLLLINILWVNTHSDSILFIAIIGIFLLRIFGQQISNFLGDREKHEKDSPQESLWKYLFTNRNNFLNLSLLPIAVLTWVINPIGIKIYSNVAGFFSGLQGINSVYISEWHTPNFASPFGYLMLSLFLLTNISFLTAKRDKNIQYWVDAAIATVAIVGTCIAIRYSLYTIVLLVPIIARNFSSLFTTERQSNYASDLPKITGIAAILILFFACTFFYNIHTKPKTSEVVPLPHEAVDFVINNPVPPRLFNSYNAGAYMQWWLPKEYLYVVDSRITPYDYEVVTKWFQTARAEEGWEKNLDEWDIGTIFLEKTNVLTKVLRYNDNDEWQLIYEDEIFVIYIREDLITSN